MGKSK